MKRVLLATLLLGLGGATASADPLHLNGSDTLFDYTKTMLSSGHCNITTDFLIYDGGGSGLGEDNMEAASQDIAPMSRALKTTKLLAGTSQGFKLGLDGLAIFEDAGDATTCVTGAYDSMFQVTDANNSGTVDCPAAVCVDGPTTPGVIDYYAVTDWRDVLRIIYGGQTEHKPLGACIDGSVSRSAINTQDCNSDIRGSLVNQFSKIFQEGTCTDPDNCSQLRHAFRRDDASGTTDVFLETLGLPDRVTKNSAAVRPFCNGAEMEDEDPIRRDCSDTSTGGSADGDEQVCNSVVASLLGPTNNSSHNTTSEIGWRGGATVNPPDADHADLGLVLPIVIPAVGAYQDLNPCSAGPSSGSFRLAPMPSGAGLTAQQRCPDGRGRSGGQCAWPARNVSGTYLFGCINKKRNVPGARTVGNMDGRVYNFLPRNADGTIQGVERVVTSASTPPVTTTITAPVLHANYRIHQSAIMPGGTFTTAGTPYVATTIGCQYADATDQIACLVGASPCSIGYAGMGGDKPQSQPLALRTPRTGTCDDDGVDNNGVGGIDEVGEPCGAVFPTQETVRRLGQPSGAQCGAGFETTSHYDIRYPLARTLYLNSRKGFTTMSTPYAADNINTTFKEDVLARCMGDRYMSDPVIVSSGFITFDDLNTSICTGPGIANAACRAPLRQY